MSALTASPACPSPPLPPALSQLEGRLCEYLLITDVEPMLVSLAVAVSQAVPGDPLWLMLVQSSSSGKTENLRLTHGVADRRLKNFTRAGLLTYTKIRNVAVPKGILCDLDAAGIERAYLTVTDFSALLEQRSGGGLEVTELFNALRDVYDGEYRRDIGGESLTWTGRITLLAACTPAIDSFSAHADSLGTRWVYFRIPDNTLSVKASMAQMALNREDLEEHRAAAEALATRIITEARGRAPRVTLPPEFGDAIAQASILAGFGRAYVPRGYRGEITDMPTVEDPGRLAGQLKTLALSLLALGLDEELALGITRRAALSSMPVSMLETLRAVVAAKGRISPKGVGQVTEDRISQMGVVRATGLHRNVVRRCLENWEVLGVIAVERTEDVELETTGRKHLHQLVPELVPTVYAGLGITAPRPSVVEEVTF